MGNKYRSKFEASTAPKLEKLAKKHKARLSYEQDALPYVLQKNYIPDFSILKKDGSEVFVELKGLLDREAMTKMLAVKEQHPDKRIVLLFMRNNKVSKNSKMYYSDWATKHGFEWAILEPNEEWFR